MNKNVTKRHGRFLKLPFMYVSLDTKEHFYITVKYLPKIMYYNIDKRNISGFIFLFNSNNFDITFFILPSKYLNTVRLINF